MVKSVAKHLIVIWNLVQIFQEGQRVYVKNFYKTKNYLITLDSCDDCLIENVSELLFPDKSQNLYGLPIYVAFVDFSDVLLRNGKIYSKWTFFADIVAEKLNGTLQYNQIIPSMESFEKFDETLKKSLTSFGVKDQLDLFINDHFPLSELTSYNFNTYCFMVPLPPKYSIFELILILPLDNLCWMWLGISVIVSFIIWSVFEGSGIQWNFLFGIYAFFVGQNTRIKT